MFSHVTLGSNDLERSKRFYDATFAALGAGPAMAGPDGRLIYVHNGAMMIITAPIDGQPATHANGGTVGIVMTPEEADAWHAAGTANGGTTCENPPGLRETPMGNYYLAYMRDPDNNKLCAFNMQSA